MEDEVAKTEREFVVLDAFDKYTDDELVEVQERLETESAAALSELAEENQRRCVAAIAAAQARASRAGVTVSVPASETTDKRARKKAQKLAEEAAAKVPNGISEETFPSLLPD